MKRNFFFIIFSFLLCGTLFAQERLTTVFLVRHAEKTATPSDDPALTPQGGTRADFLVRILENSGLTAIYTSQFARTKLTAEPIARKLRIPVQTIDAGSTKKLVETILAKNSGGTVLVVGHSNTLPEIAEALGAGKSQEIADEDYDNLYVVTLARKGTAKLVRLKFFASPTEQVCQ